MADTIYALATPPGRSGLAVVRVSGPQAFSGLQKLTAGTPAPPPRRASLRTLSHPVSRETIDQALILTFKAPSSYTGEDIVEYHVHGSRAVVSALLEALSSLDETRPATPGEFTRRAFENGRIDLTEAEAVADLIDAETHAQRLQALNQMNGTLSALYEDWRARLIRTLAHLEADLDFPDEDLPEGLPQTLRPAIETLLKDMAAHLNDSHRGERLRDGLRVVVLGPPNAGKSTLVNALARREVAIVSDLPGTTRDRIEVALDIGGYPVLLSDTAGLRAQNTDSQENTHEAIEKQGIERALEAAQNADLRILLFDGQTLPDLDDRTLAWVNRAPSDLIAVNKTDRMGQPPPPEINGLPILPISARTGQGMEALTARLTESLATLCHPGETPSLTRSRHREGLQRCRDSLTRALHAPMPELAAEDLRLAARALGQITGRVDVDDLLDVIFKDFCIGK
ncbi:MAG TPA: tRNA uridine-5-carboxymethylaminomethyl(34) synthesis GTPase MnmE [Alphaproteobacteria bacterium]|nr:tRNA uridine-5-carboxymethylaminomethyl(34) synthesis GTPase MnmE [Alphaproteobacteria bacterium]